MLKSVFLVLALFALSLAQLTPIDLRTWTQEGQLSNGTWNVSEDGFSVKQTRNGSPTFFVSPDTLINTTFHGEVRVETTSDNDYIGIVLGYEKPIRANGDADNEYKYILFDWKQANQVFSGRLAKEGWALSRVDGTFDDIGPHFWAHQSADSFAVIDSLYGTDYGWGDNALYDVDILYEESHIRIMVDSMVVFDTTGTFPAGRFGFYNYSQAQVRYQGFSQNQYPLAQNDMVQVEEDSLTLIFPLENDSDADGNPVYISSFDSTSNGLLLRVSDSAFSYTPQPDFFGADSFRYVITDSVSGSDTAFVHIEVTPVNDSPQPFALLTPPNGTMMDSLTQQLTFRWTTSNDVDGDEIIYTWHIFGDSVSATAAVADTFLLFDEDSFLVADEAYTWTVSASDGFEVVLSDSFTLETPPATSLDNFDTPFMPTAYKLHPNRPNPFNPSTRIVYDLKEAVEITLAVYNVRGQKMRVLEQGKIEAGRHSTVWDGRDARGVQLSSGIYFIRLQTADGFVKTGKMMLLK